MRTFVITLIVLLGLSCAGFVKAGNFDEIYNKYKNEQNVSGLEINKFGCMLLSLFGNVDTDEELGKIMKKSSGFRILTTENSRNKNLERDVRNYIRSNKMELLMSVSGKEKETVDIYVVDKNQVVHQLLITVSGKDNQTVLHIDGRYPLKMVNELINGENSSLTVKIGK